MSQMLLHDLSRRLSIGIVATLFGLCIIVYSAKAIQGVDVAKQAGDVLKQRCIACHNSAKHAGGIDLSTRSTTVSSHVIDPAAPGETRLERAVASGKMPPTGKLTASEIATVKRWVASGAVYPSPKLEPEAPANAPLWSFQPVRCPNVPHSKFDSLSSNPVDRFVFAKLAASGLRPSPPADKRSLLRRVTLDLTGLPPTPEEMTAFVADRRPDAYERVVDRLLASPAYGERWGRHWLDVVRYGESNGYEQNHVRPDAWPYRDYVIRAFNEDMPYPQFVSEQLAGDYLARSNPGAGAGTGFLVAGTHDTVGIQTEEGTRQQRSNDLDDIVSTTGATFLGLTVGCAKCHDHKFDPIPQRDFYRLTACFAGVRHGTRLVREPTDANRKVLVGALARQDELQNALNSLDNDARTALLRKRGASPSSRPAANARRNDDLFSPRSARFVRFTILATNDGSQPCLDELQVFGPGSRANIALASAGGRATASTLLPGYAIHKVEHLNDGKLGNDHSWISDTSNSGWAQIELRTEQVVERVVWSRDGGEIPKFDDRLPVKYRIETSVDGTNWRLASTEAGRTGTNDYVHPDDLRSVMTPEQRKLRSSIEEQLVSVKATIAELRGLDRAYVGQFTTPDPIFVLRRGDVMQRGDEVGPGGLSRILALNSDLLPGGTASEPERRLALARWITNSANPLTARVYVNRVWQHHFGRGIVSTPSDFGRNGDTPSHPELMDWLASKFMLQSSTKSTRPGASTAADGLSWRTKPLHRLLVTSYTYRQSSAPNQSGSDKDAANVLLWRMNLNRMEAEAVRDAVLATSGKLNRRLGGPSFKLFKYNVVNVAIYEPMDQFAPDTWRRGVYQQAARGIRDDLLGAFDCPESSQRAPKRESTTTALQALSMLNGSFILQQAGFFSDRIKAEIGADPRRQVNRAFELAYCRTPAAGEQETAQLLIRRNGLEALCRALLNSNEFLYY